MTAQHYITTARLDIYRKHLKVKPAQVMAAYHWNKALAGALLPAMQCLEVTLRNAINTAIQSFRHCCKVSDEAAFCLIQRPYISKTLLTRRISPRGSP